MTIIGLLISIAALAVSVWAILSSRDTASLQRHVQERLLSLESARERDRLQEAASAALQAFVERHGGDYRLVVANVGASSARMIKTTIDGKPLLEHALIPQGEQEVTMLAPMAAARYHLAVAMGSPSLVTVRLEWEDDTGAPKQWDSQIKIL